MPDRANEDTPCLDALINALWQARMTAGNPSYDELEKRSRKILGETNALRRSTTHSAITGKNLTPPPWPFVQRLWRVLCDWAAQHDIDPSRLGTLENLKLLHEAACWEERRNRVPAAVRAVGPLSGTTPDRKSDDTIVPAQQASPLLASIRTRTGSTWWHEYRDVVPGWFELFLSLEPAAHLIHVYDTAVIPGLLQTREYADWTIRLEPYPERSAETANRIIDLRMHRSRILDHSHPPSRDSSKSRVLFSLVKSP